MSVRGRVVLAACLACAALARAAAAQTPAPDLIGADRPGLAESSQVVGARRLQIESGIQHDSHGAEKTIFIPTLLRIGLSDAWEARIEGNTFSTMRAAGGARDTPRVSGIAPISVGFKYHLPDAADSRRPGLGVIGRIFPAWGSGDFRSNRFTGDLRLAADWDFAPEFSLNPNIGIARVEGDDETTFAAAIFAVTLSYAAHPALSLFIDLGLQTPETAGGAAGATFDGGIAYIVGRHVQLDVSAGTRALGRLGPQPFIGAGVSVRTK